MAKNRRIKGKQSKRGDRIKPPTTGEPSSSDPHPPIFSLRHLDNRDFSLDNCDNKEKVAFVETLCRLGKIPWRELRQAGRHGMGYEKIHTNSLKVGIPKNITPDVNFIAFRFSGKAPMVGYRDRAVFHIIWIDRNFTLYKH